MLPFCTNSFSAFPSHSGKKLRLSHWPILSSTSLLLFPSPLFLFTLLQPYQRTPHSHVPQRRYACSCCRPVPLLYPQWNSLPSEIHMAHLSLSFKSLPKYSKFLLTIVTMFYMIYNIMVAGTQKAPNQNC